jgi:peptidoglycan/LPS O-acetylase OafA/YrhL
MAWWVVAGHVSLALNWDLPLIDSNKLAVDVFILLSGFVIALLVERKAETYPAYLVRRGFRLFPLYIVVLIASSILLPVQLAAWKAAPPTGVNLYRVALAQEAISNFGFHFLTHVPLLQGIVPKCINSEVAYTIVGQAWSISLEWQFYIVAPALILAMLSRRWFIAVAGLISLAAPSFLFTDAYIGGKILLFSVGIATKAALRPERRSESLTALTVCAIGAVLMDGLAQILPLGI